MAQWRDTAALAGRFAAQLLRAGADAAVGRGVPRRAEALTPAWFEERLDAARRGTRVREVEVMSGHTGTTTRARLRLHAAGDALPETVFVKLAPASLLQRAFVGVAGLGRTEVAFYRAIRPGLAMRAPAVYAAAATPFHTHFVLVLEDLAASGCTFADVGERCTLAQARAVVHALAALHAQFWESPRFAGDLRWVLDREADRRNMAWQRALTALLVERAVARCRDELDPQVRRGARLLQTHRDRLETLWARGPHTLVHGDAHLGNAFFDGERAGFLDWQIVRRAPGMRDVGYFLTNSIPTALRRRHERELVRTYLDALAAGGVATAPTFDEAWDAYRLVALYAFIAAATTVAATTWQPESVARAGLRRAAATLLDLDTVGRLEREIER